MDRLSRFAPLTGVVFAVLAVVAFGTASGAPKETASGAQVVAFFEAHGSQQQVSDSLWGLAVAFFLLFVGSLRAHLRLTPAAEALSSLMLAGAAVVTCGAAVYFGFDYTLATAAKHLDPAAAQALNMVALKLILPLVVGCFVFGLAGGLAIIRGTLLPNWLGWAAIAIAIVTVTPVGLVGLFLLVLWVPTVGVLVWRRSGSASVFGDGFERAVPGD
jgi:hypothetical protein